MTSAAVERQDCSMTSQVDEEGEARPWEEPWESLKVNESKEMEQGLDDVDRQVRFWRHRPDGFTVNERSTSFIF
jgi:hypothetical protein